MKKICTITLVAGAWDAKTGAERWLVTRVTDSIEHWPGERLPKEVVAALCASRDWKVTITK